VASEDFWAVQGEEFIGASLVARDLAFGQHCSWDLVYLAAAEAAAKKSIRAVAAEEMPSSPRSSQYRLQLLEFPG
jgi:hypothetical protein